MTTAEARSLYANEKARRAERLAQRPELREAHAEFARQLAAQRQAGKGGRPRKDHAGHGGERATGVEAPRAMRGRAPADS